MSNALAIASVTAVLKDMLDNVMINQSVSTTVGDQVLVTSLPPDRINIGTNEKAQLNLYLYHVRHNQGWQNVGLPSHDVQGQRITNPPLALDLYYLLTAYTNQDFDTEILLGYGMQTLHEVPVLTREAIRKVLGAQQSTSCISGELLTQAGNKLSASDLADQVELIKISPHQVSTEEMSKLWSAFQAKYRPSAAYHVSVVLIEGCRSTRSSLPVKERHLYAVPFHQPVIEYAVSSHGANQPIFADSTLFIYGKQLLADAVLVRVGGIEAVPSYQDITDKKISLKLPSGLLAGMQGVQIVHQIMMGKPSTEHNIVESNVSAFILRPTITIESFSIEESQSVNDAHFYTVNITVNFNPAVGKKQRVLMLMNERNPPENRTARSYSFYTPSRDQDTDSINITLKNMEAGEYLVRVQVDGAESPLEVDTDQESPTFNQYIGPKITIS